MRALIVTPDRNHRGSDWSGAFAVEAARLCQLYGLAPSEVRLSVNIGNPPATQRAQLLQALGERQDLDLVAILCHGWRTGLQIGWGRKDVDVLAQALAESGAAGLKVVLYACSTAADGEGQEPGAGAGEGSFADALRDALARTWPAWAGWVDAHDRAGHCCSNPFVVRFLPPAGAGGCPLIEPGTPAWAAWAEALKDRDHSTLRLRFPLLTRAQILEELA